MVFTDEVKSLLGRTAEVLVRTPPSAMTQEMMDATVFALREGERALIELRQDLRVLEHDLSVEKQANLRLRKSS